MQALSYYVEFSIHVPPPSHETAWVEIYVLLCGKLASTCIIKYAGKAFLCVLKARAVSVICHIRSSSSLHNVIQTLVNNSKVLSAP